MARPQKKIDDVEIKKIELSLKKLQATASHPLRQLRPLIAALIASGHTLGDIHAHLVGDGLKLNRRSLAALMNAPDRAAGTPKSGNDKEQAPQPKTRPATNGDAVSQREGAPTVPTPKSGDGAGPAQSEKRTEISVSRPVAEGGEKQSQGQQLGQDRPRPAASAGGGLSDQFNTPRETPQGPLSSAREQLQWPPQTTPRGEVASRDENRMREAGSGDRPSDAARRFDSSTGGGA